MESVARPAGATTKTPSLPNCGAALLPRGRHHYYQATREGSLLREPCPVASWDDQARGPEPQLLRAIAGCHCCSSGRRGRRLRAREPHSTHVCSLEVASCESGKEARHFGAGPHP